MTFKNLPSVDRFFGWAQKEGLTDHYPRLLILNYIRNILQKKRDLLKKELARSDEEPSRSHPAPLWNDSPASFILELKGLLVSYQRSALQRVINGTGVVVHTNLGRSLLAEEALQKIMEIGRSYSNLEIDLSTGFRGSRLKHLSELLSHLTNAEAALAVNNNAAAVMLALETVAKGKEVIVSRGELVEIGGSFRLPAIMAKSGVILKEVGTTNKTNLKDYAEAINERTGLLLKVHPSNFAMIGFTQNVELQELVELGKISGLAVMEDLGSGDLFDLALEGFGKDLTIVEAIKSGVDLLTISGDKLLGGPQAGIILGKKRYLDLLKDNPLYRALRVDKLILAALEATVELYFDRDKAKETIPTLSLLCMNPQEVAKRGQRLLRSIRQRLPRDKVELKLEKDFSEVGGGAYPMQKIPTTLLTVSFPSLTAAALEQQLRFSKPPILGRILNDRFCLDLRTILDHDFPDITKTLTEIRMTPDEE